MQNFQTNMYYIHVYMRQDLEKQDESDKYQKANISKVHQLLVSRDKTQT